MPFIIIGGYILMGFLCSVAWLAYLKVDQDRNFKIVEAEYLQELKDKKDRRYSINKPVKKSDIDLFMQDPIGILTAVMWPLTLTAGVLGGVLTLLYQVVFCKCYKFFYRKTLNFFVWIFKEIIDPKSNIPTNDS